MQYYFLKSLCGKTWALIGTALILSANFFVSMASTGYRDVILMIYTCCPVMFLLLWVKYHQDGYLILAGVFMGLMSFVKLEGQPYLLIHIFSFVLMIVLFRQSRLSYKEWLLKGAKFIMPGLCLLLPFVLLKKIEQIAPPGKFEIVPIWENANAVPGLLKTFFKYLFVEGNWNVLWLIMLVSYINLPSVIRKKEIIFLTIVLAAFFGFYLFLGVVTSYSETAFNEVYSRIDVTRLVLHFYPLAVWLIVLLNGSEKNLMKKSDSNGQIIES